MKQSNLFLFTFAILLCIAVVVIGFSSLPLIGDHNNQPKIVEVDSSTSILHFRGQAHDGQIRFTTLPAETRIVKLFPNRGERQRKGITSVSNITGVTHFFMDHDPATGFVHETIHNFYRKLRPEDYVMRLQKTATKNCRQISFCKKNTLTEKDTLGIQIAFFRQWKLDELAITGGKILLKAASFSSRLYCPQVKATCGNPFKAEMPVGVIAEQEGYYAIENLNQLNLDEGATVFIIWEESEKIFFEDVNGSLADILNAAKNIATEYHTNPTIAIGDGGPFHQKFIADEKHKLDTRLIDDIEPNCDYCGAGFGYLIEQ